MASAKTTVSSAGPILGRHTGGLKKLGRWTLKGDNLQPTYPPRLDSGTPAERPAPGRGQLAIGYLNKAESS